MREYEDAMLEVQGSMYEYLMYEYLEVHGNKKHVVRWMLRPTRFDGWTVMVELWWGIRVAQQNMVKVGGIDIVRLVYVMFWGS